MFVGAQSMPILGSDYQPIDDVQVVDASHPLAAGWVADDVFPLLPSESGVPALVVAEAIDDEFQVILARGPDSADSGTPALIAAVDETEDVSHIVIAAFALYRLPEDVQHTLVLNAVEWLMDASRIEAAAESSGLGLVAACGCTCHAPAPGKRLAYHHNQQARESQSLSS